MTTQFLLPDLEHDEGCRLQAYPDPRTKGPPWTIGYGHTGREVHPGLVWTMAQARAALASDVSMVEVGLDTAAQWWEGLTDVRQDVLVNAAFNLGVHGLMGFPHALAAARDGDYKTAAINLLWNNQAQGDKTHWYSELPLRAGRLAYQLFKGERTAPGDWLARIKAEGTAWESELR